jgi:hypothetical protein
MNIALDLIWLEVIDLERCIMYIRPMLFDRTITFLVVRSFIDKPKGSNSI